MSADAAVRRGEAGDAGETTSTAGALTVPASPAARSAAKANYARVILARLQRAIRYPRAAQRRGIEGVVRVQVELSATGGLRSVALAQSSGHTVLDNAAVALVQRVAPFPPVPEGLLGPQGSFAFVAPIQYQLD